MPHSDLALAELERYQPELAEPADFDSFWAQTLERSPGGATFTDTPVASGLRAIDVYDVTFAGHGGAPVKAWLAVPAGTREPLPCVVEYPGYGGGRGLAHDVLFYAAAGFAHLFMDVRGQGSGWRPGDTPDPERAGAGPHHPGFVTQGIADPHTYYYCRVVTDAVRAVEAARGHPMVDPARVAVTGESQGGGLALAVAALVPDIAAVLPDVPFLCHFRRAAEIASTGPYLELVNYLKVHRTQVSSVFETLSYVDGVSFAARARCPALFSVALMDTTCPPSTVYAAYHAYAGPRRIEVYPFNGHEGGQTHHALARLTFLAEHLRPAGSGVGGAF